jgi:hypothetical protein
MPSLRIERSGSSSFPWEIQVGDGPSAGMRYGDRHRLKRDAQAVVDQHGHLPWEHLHPTIEAAMASADPIVTVSRAELAWLLRLKASAERDLKIANAALLEFDGSAMAVMRARDQLKAEEAKSA